MICIYSLAGHVDAIKSLVVLSNIDGLASAGYDCKIKVWGLNEKKIVDINKIIISCIQQMKLMISQLDQLNMLKRKEYY